MFSDHVQAFQLATATRHMIYSGELTHVDEDGTTEVNIFTVNLFIVCAYLNYLCQLVICVYILNSQLELQNHNVVEIL